MFGIFKSSGQKEKERLEQEKARLEKDKKDLEWKVNNLRNILEKAKREIHQRRDAAVFEVQAATRQAQLEADEEIKQINAELDEERELVKKIKSTAIKDFPVIATMLADIQEQRDLLSEEALRHKKRPAIKAADEIKKIREEKKKLAEQYHSCKWELEHLKELLPWIEDIEEDPVVPITEVYNPDFNKSDQAGYWLTPDEYAKLSTVEKYQRALDRYCERHNKPNWEIGREYERYIGYLCEKEGYKVEYFGIEKGLEDLGRDLVCTNDKEIMIIQCKCWSNKKNKVIHEKHINQLYGTATMYKIQNKKTKKKVRAVFVSTVPCTDTAKEFADYLGVTFKQIPLEKYPMIKCNINSQTKEKIYHLPFDQQYDKCTIKSGTGEFYAMSVQEAEDNGFRRAMKWHGK